MSLLERPATYTAATDDYAAKMKRAGAGLDIDWIGASVAMENLEDPKGGMNSLHIRMTGREGWLTSVGIDHANRCGKSHPVSSTQPYQMRHQRLPVARLQYAWLRKLRHL